MWYPRELATLLQPSTPALGTEREKFNQTSLFFLFLLRALLVGNCREGVKYHGKTAKCRVVHPKLREGSTL